jgi:hypothetical protein
MGWKVLIAAAAAAMATFGSSMPAVAQTVVHVSPTGDDDADGTQARPLKTLHEAQRRARDVTTWDAKGVRVELAPGEYVLEEPLVFTPKDSGKSSDASVIYAGRGRVVVSGGRRIGPWRPEGEHWIAEAPIAGGSSAENDGAKLSFRDLWVNGRRATRARTPNEGYFRIEAAGPDNRTSFIVAPEDLQTIAEPQLAEVAFLHDWSMSRINLSSIDEASRTYHFAAPIGASQPQFAIANFETNPRYFLENAREFLDAPGEWFLDETKGQVHYVPRAGESPDAAVAIAPQLEQLVIVRGDDQEVVENLSFHDITFSHTRFALPPFGYAGVQSSWHSRRTTADDDAGVTMPSAVMVDHARHIQFINCRFQELAACGIHLARCQESRLGRCVFRDIGGDGILIGTRDQNDSPPAGNNTVVNCLIENCGVNFYGAVGLWIGFAHNTTVSHNELRHLPYTGVSVGWQWNDEATPCRDNRIRQNHIHHIMNALSDGGGIYTLGRQPGTRLMRNLIHDVPVNAGRAESNGIFMDEGSTDIIVSGNTIYNIARSPIRFHRAGKNTLVNNRLVSKPSIPTFSYLAADPAGMVMKGNEEISAEPWQPPADDPALNEAGLGVDLD